MLEQFRFLEPDDWLLLDPIMIRQAFTHGQVVLSEGERSPGVYLIRSGSAGVELSRQRVGIAAMHAGEWFGEMSLVGDVPATATIVARGPLVVELLPAGDLMPLLTLSQGLSARFYRSLACLLAQRLQHRVAELAPLLRLV